MTSQVFEICLLCLGECGKEDNVATEAPIFIQRQLSYTMLLRYLKIDALKLGQLSSSFETFLAGGSEGGNANLEVLLCSNCSAVTIEFLELFQVFDEARLRLDEICGELLNRIREGEEDQGRLENYRKSVENVSQLSSKPVDAFLNASLTESLRNETKQKCSERLSKSIPKVALSRVDSCKRRKIDSAISKENDPTTEYQDYLQKCLNLAAANKSSQYAQDEHIKMVDPLLEDYIESIETNLGANAALNQMEAEDKSAPQMDSPFEEEMIPPSPPIIDLTHDQSPSPESSFVVEASLELAPHSDFSEDVEFGEVATQENIASMETELGVGDAAVIVTQIEIERRSPPGSPHEEVVFHNPRSYPTPTFDLALPTESIKPLEPVLATSPFNKKSIKKRIKCQHCENTFKKMDYLREHMILFHPLIKYASRLPPNTTMAQIKSAVEFTAFGEKRKPVKTDGKFTCFICSRKLPHANRLRIHVLINHFDKMMDSLGKAVVEEVHQISAKIGDDADGHNSITQDQEDCRMGNDEETPLLLANFQLADNSVLPPAEEGLEDQLSSDPLRANPVPCSSLPVEGPLPPASNTMMSSTCGTQVGSHPQAAFKMSTPQFFLCSQCWTMFQTKVLLDSHLMSAHTFKFFESRGRLPPSTSEVDLEQAINNSFGHTSKIISGGRIEDVFGCGLCPGKNLVFAQQHELRMHILENHFDLVTSKILQKKLAAKGIVQIAKMSSQNNAGEKAAIHGENYKCNCPLCSDDFVSAHSSIEQNTLSSSSNGMEILLCNYCDQCFHLTETFRHHLMDDHPIIVFSGHLPPGTTESGFNKVIDSLEGRTSLEEESGVAIVKFQCPCCPQIFTDKVLIRQHILHMHFNHVLESLEKRVAQQEVTEVQDRDDFRISIPSLTTTFTSTNVAFTSAAPVVANTVQGTLSNPVVSLLLLHTLETSEN